MHYSVIRQAPIKGLECFRKKLFRSQYVQAGNVNRYGLLSRERIISKEDIKSYLLHKLGKYVESVEVGNGVAISPDSKKGLIRVTEVKIKLGQFDKDEIPNLEELAHYLEKDLTERSVCNSNYKIKFV